MSHTGASVHAWAHAWKGGTLCDILYTFVNADPALRATAMYVSWRLRYNDSMSIAVSAVYAIALCVCGWRAIYRGGARRRGEYRWYDVLLWLSGAVLVLIPVIADVTNAVGWSDPDILYPTIFSVGWVVALLVWDVRSGRSRAHENRRASVGEDA